MNYLAHLYLAQGDRELMIGSLLGDFVKGSFQGLYTPGIRCGIDLHRRIDSYTDSHAIVRISKHRISPQRRRFAGIMVDLVYDHFLAAHWSDYSPLPLSAFSQQVYGMLLQYEAALPDALQRMLPAMMAEDWLTSYRELAHVGRSLNGISRRLKRQNNSLLNSVEELEWHYEALEADFQQFFPQLMQFVAQHPSV